MNVGEWRRPALLQSTLTAPRRKPNKIHVVAELLLHGRWRALCDPALQTPLLPGPVEDGTADACKKCLNKVYR